MKNHFSKSLLIFTLLMLLLTACQSQNSNKEADEIYWEYYQACEDGNYETAKEFITEEAMEQSASVGVCGFTHDAINDYLIARGEAERTFSQEPSFSNEGNRAVMTWIDDQGNLANVFLNKTEDGWKISDALWSN